jgi:AraC-like DNA-binding protein
MPLYMEFHKARNMAMTDLTARAAAARELLDKFSIQYHHLWINEEAEEVFCLIEGPDRSICEAVHKSIFGSEFETFAPVKECFPLGNITIPAHQRSDSDISGAGFLVAVESTFVAHDGALTSGTTIFFDACKSAIKHHNGIPTDEKERPCVIGYFSSGDAAQACARNLQGSWLRSGFNNFRIAVLQNHFSSFKPGNNTSDSARRILSIAEDSWIVFSSQLRRFLHGQMNSAYPAFRVLSPHDEQFLEQLSGIIDNHLHDDSFNVDALARRVGMSRPHLYRKVHALTGRSANIFIRDLRMERALLLLKRRDRNICEVAFEVGYTNPSYFARTFSGKYGCTPSCFLMHSEHEL